MPSFVPTFSSYSESQILSDCGAFVFLLHKFESNTADLTENSYDASIFQQDDSSSPPTIRVETSDPLKASTDTSNYKTTYSLTLMGQMGDNWKNRAYITFDVIVKDYCWVSVLSQPPTQTIVD